MVLRDINPADERPEDLPLVLQGSGGEYLLSGRQRVDGIICGERGGSTRLLLKIGRKLLLFLMQFIHPALDHIQINTADLVQVNQLAFLFAQIREAGADHIGRGGGGSGSRSRRAPHQIGIQRKAAHLRDHPSIQFRNTDPDIIAAGAVIDTLHGRIWLCMFAVILPGARLASSAALAAVNHPCEQLRPLKVLRESTDGSAEVAVILLLDTVKSVLINDRFVRPLVPDAGEADLSNVNPVTEHPGDGGNVRPVPVFGLVFAVHPPRNLLERQIGVQEERKDLPYLCSLIRINDKPAIRIGVADRDPRTSGEISRLRTADPAHRHALCDLVTFQLRKDGQDSDHCLSEGASGVEILTHRYQTDLMCPEDVLNQVQSVLLRPGQPVKLIHNYGIKKTIRAVTYQLLDRGPLELCSGKAGIRVDMRNLPAVRFAEFGKTALLFPDGIALGGLLLRGNTAIDSNVHIHLLNENWRKTARLKQCARGDTIKSARYMVPSGNAAALVLQRRGGFLYMKKAEQTSYEYNAAPQKATLFSM